MQRARRAGLSALIALVILIGAIAPAQPDSEARLRLLADVSWPPSTLVVSEVQTGGTSASDEFVEVANQGAAAVDLGGLELVYVTASGTTITRKATWASPAIRAGEPWSSTARASSHRSGTRRTRAGLPRRVAPWFFGSSAVRRSMPLGGAMP